MSSGSLVAMYPLEEEYKKDTGIKPEDIATFREWLKTQPHLPEEHITDLDLILVYHCCDRDLETSKHLLDTHFTLKTTYTLLFKDLYFDSKIEKVLRTMLMQPLAGRTKEGYAIFYSRIIVSDPQSFVHVDCIRAMMMIWEMWQNEEGTWPGIVLVSDLSGFGFGHFYRTHWTAMQQQTKFLQEALLGKLKQIHILNAPSFFDKMLAMCKPFLRKALLDMIHIHRVGATDFEEYFPTEALPIDAGGSWKTVDQCRTEVIEKFKANGDFFAACNKKRVDETKRPGGGKEKTGYFGGFWS